MFKTKSVEIKDVVIMSRHPFGRFDTIRTLSKADGKECADCNRPAHFHYGFWPDSGNEGLWVYTEGFCSIGCYRDFYGR